MVRLPKARDSRTAVLGWLLAGFAAASLVISGVACGDSNGGDKATPSGGDATSDAGSGSGSDGGVPGLDSGSDQGSGGTPDAGDATPPPPPWGVGTGCLF